MKRLNTCTKKKRDGEGRGKGGRGTYYIYVTLYAESVVVENLWLMI